jgi:hypothetical protein
MRRSIVIFALLLAGCNDAGQWENEQNELANELNGTAPVADDTNLSSETDYLNTTGNDANATSPTQNDLNAVAPAAENGTTPPP